MVTVEDRELLLWLVTIKTLEGNVFQTPYALESTGRLQFMP